MNNRENHSKIIIGLDHGYGNIKTAHRVFMTGIECFDEEPIVSTNYVEYKGRYYVIGENHLVYQGNKTESDDFYVLTLAGLAEEMKFRGLREAKVVLAAGLPLAWAKSQAADFRKYLMRESDIAFSYQKQRYTVHLCGVEIFPQGFAAVCSAGNMQGFNMIADIGNGTMNIMQIIDGRPQESSVATEKLGVSICMKEIQQMLAKSSGERVHEMLIEPLLRNGTAGRTDKVAQTVKRAATRYAECIMKQLVTSGYQKDLTHLYVVGGGGCLLRNFGNLDGKQNVTFITDICANAKGYELLAEQKQRLRRQAG